MEMCLHFPSNSSGLGIRSTAPPKFTTTKEAEVRKEECLALQHINGEEGRLTVASFKLSE
ncbi:hypothetical protein KY285_033606 [Solanum tuberosum]|nr:hypothetical protein KY285_033606 [Solanum tuberosum]